MRRNYRTPACWLGHLLLAASLGIILNGSVAQPDPDLEWTTNLPVTGGFPDDYDFSGDVDPDPDSDLTLPDFFYPAGPEEGDRLAPANDDGSTGRLDIAIPFPYFDNLHPNLFVNTNGALSFLSEISQYTPDPLPLGDGRRLVAPFWTDIDLRRNAGRLYYRETTQDPGVLERATADVRSAFVNQGNFQAAWVFIATWYRVTFYGGSSSTPVNTFQAVLVTNGRHSFVIFNYGNITWTTGTASGGNSSTGLGGTPAQAGFNAGDSVRYFSVPGSRTPAIVDVETTSNVGLPGRWVFRTDENDVVAGGCNTAGSVAMGPRFASSLGGKRVIVAGPCFDVTTDVVWCRFDDNLVPGEIVDETHAACVVPMTFNLNRIPFALSVDGGQTFNYSGVFWIVEEEDEAHTVTQVDPEAWAARDLNQELLIEWHSDVLTTDTVSVEFVTFKRAPDGSIATEAVMLVPEATNIGSLVLPDRLEHAENLIRATFGAIRITEIGNPAERTQSLWTTVGQAVWYNNLYFYEVTLRHLHALRHKRDILSDLQDAWDAVTTFVDTTVENIKEAVSDAIADISDSVFGPQCENWVAEEQANPPDFENVTPAPCNMDQANRDPDFTPDDACNMGGPLCWFFHPGAFHCVRSTQPSSDGGGQQACYDREGNLLPFENGGGTYDRSHTSNKLSHFLDDVWPFMTCCKLSNNCAKYGEARPSDDCDGYEEPGPAGTTGDPHIITLDGKHYTFNGVGEYVLLDILESLVIQARAEALGDGPWQGSAWTCFAMRARGSDTVQVQVSERLGIEVLLNGETLDFEDLRSQQYDGVRVSQELGSGQVSVRFDSGVVVTVIESEGTLNFLIVVRPTARGNTRGLLGVWNNDPDDDFLTPNGTTVPSTASESEIHHRFGETWRTSESNSLFTYPTGRSHADYQNPGFTPVFGLPPASPEQLQRAREVCGEDTECQFDYLVTGNENLAVVGMAVRQVYDRMVNHTASAPRTSSAPDSTTTEQTTSGSTADRTTTASSGSGTCNDGYQTKQAVPGDSAGYLWLHEGRVFPMQCAPGTVFSVDHCGCIHPPVVSTADRTTTASSGSETSTEGATVAAAPDACVTFDEAWSEWGVTLEGGTWIQPVDINLAYNGCVKGRCAKFESTSLIKMPSYSSAFSGYSQFAVSLWFKRVNQETSATEELGLVNNGQCNGQGSIQLKSYNASLCQGRIDTQYGSVQVNAHFRSGDWNHVVMSYNGNQVSLYVNGARISSHALSGNIKNNWCPMAVGRGFGDQTSFVGYMDEICIYKGNSLTEPQVREIYDEMSQP